MGCVYFILLKIYWGSLQCLFWWCAFPRSGSFHANSSKTGLEFSPGWFNREQQNIPFGKLLPLLATVAPVGRSFTWLDTVLTWYPAPYKNMVSSFNLRRFQNNYCISFCHHLIHSSAWTFKRNQSLRWRSKGAVKWDATVYCSQLHLSTVSITVTEGEGKKSCRSFSVLWFYIVSFWLR